MQLKWIIAGILLIGLITCQAQAVLFDWLFGTTSNDGTTTIANISEGAWYNGTATIESLDTTTGDVTIHYTMEYVPTDGGVTVQLVNNLTRRPEWSGDAHQTEGTWKFCLKDSYYPPDAPNSFPDGYTARLYKNEVEP